MTRWTGSATTTASSRQKILLVDDEQAILDGLRRQLRREFDVSTASSGVAGLELMESATFAVVLSDMRMPGMDGATFLAEVRERSAETVRMLLTGQADTESAIAAINEGQVFRFLTKPCAHEALLCALKEGAELYRSRHAEKEILEETLKGAVKALTDTLAVAQPTAFSRAARITRTVSEVATKLGVASWEIEVAALLAHLGTVSLPPRVLDKLDAGRLLDEDEQEMVERTPALAAGLIAAVPRLGDVAEAVAAQRCRFDGKGRPSAEPRGLDIPLAARLLKAAVDFDTLSSQRLSAPAAFTHMRKDAGAYDPRVLKALESCFTDDGGEDIPREVSIEEMVTGMILLEDVVALRGTVLLGRGSIVTETTLQRLHNYTARETVSGPFIVSANRRA